MAEVYWKKKIDRKLQDLPIFIVEKFRAWVASVQVDGLRETRKRSGFHDEPLKGQRQGQRSVRLNRSYRAIYIERDSKIELIEVIEVNKHEH